MAQARELEAQRRKQAELRRIEREKRLAINTGKWEALLGRDFSVDKVKEDPALRKLWFEGAPSHLRGKAWSLAIGNPLAMSKGECNEIHLLTLPNRIADFRRVQDVLG